VIQSFLPYIPLHVYIHYHISLLPTIFLQYVIVLHIISFDFKTTSELYTIIFWNQHFDNIFIISNSISESISQPSVHSFIHSSQLLSSDFFTPSFFSTHISLLPYHYREIHKISKAIRAEFARGDGRIKRKEDDRRKRIVPSETLFVVNFHEETTKREDLEMLFAPYGELVRIDMKRNYAFVQFTSVECASKAKDATNGGKLDQSVITVEYVAQRIVDDRRRDRGRGDRDRDHRGYRGRDYRGGYRRDDDYRRRDDRYDDMRRDRYDDYRGGFRGGRDRSPPRDRYDDYRGRRRSRSRSPIYRYRSRTPSPRRDRDDYRGSRGGGYDDYRAAGSGRSNERGVERNEYRDLERGLSTERDYRSGDVRGYK